MAVEASGLSMLLDTVGSQLEAAAANRAQLRGYGPALQATGIPVQNPNSTLFQSMFGVGMDGTPASDPSANAPRFLSRLIGGGSGNSEASAAGMPLARMSPAAGAAAPTPMSRIPTSSISSTQDAGTAPPSDLAHQAASFFVDKGLSPVGAAGLVGNLMRESGMRTNAVAAGDGADGSNSIGVAQWNGDRARGLHQYAAANNADPSDLHTQLGYAWHELNTTERPALAALQAATNPLQAAAAGAGYERPAGWTPQNPAGSKDFGRRLAATVGIGNALAAAPPGAMAYAGGQGQGDGSVIPAAYSPDGGTPASRSATAAPPSTDQIQALVRDPATREQGLAAWRQQLTAPASASGMVLPAGLTPAALGAMIQEPATRAQGLALWEQMLAPKSAQFAKPGDMAFVNGRPTYQVPYAPMDVAPGNTVVDPNGGRTIAAAPPKLEHTEIGRDAFGQPTFGSFNPQSGTVAPFPGAPGIVPDGSGGTAGGQGQPSGQAFLDTLPPVMANQVKAIAEGRMTLPTGMGANSPLAQRLRAGVLQYDPKFDTTDVEARAKTRADYASGNTAQAITAGNTAIQHLGELSDAAEALQNSRFPLANAVGQAVGNATGGNLPGVAFNNILGKYVEEATKFYRGSGGTEADIQRDIGNLSPTMSPDQLRAALQAQSGLLRGKVTALQSRWRQGMGPLAGDYPIIAPPSAAVLSRIEGRPPKMSSYGGLGAAQAALPTAAPAGGGKGDMPTLSDPAQVRQLASGTRFRTPDGRVGVAP